MPPSDQATGQTNYYGVKVHFAFGIPQGCPGAAEEVSLAQLNGAIATTAVNPTNVQPLVATVRGGRMSNQCAVRAQPQVGEYLHRT